MKKLICILLTLCMALSGVSLCAAAVPKAARNVSLEQFLTDGKALLGQYAEPEQAPDTVTAAGEAAQTYARLIARAHGAIDTCGAVAAAGPFDNVYILQYADAAAADEAYAALKKDSRVEWVVFDRKITVQGNPTAEAIPGIAADGSAHFSWGADYLGVDAYYEAVGTQAEQVTVAVIDTGIDTDHPLFGGFYSASNPDGRILPNGACLTGFSDSFEDDAHHGTHVSGTITELTPSYVKILPVKVLNHSGGCTDATLMMGVLYAVSQNADILNLSLGGGITEDNTMLRYCMEYAFERNVLSVVAAGNEAADTSGVSPAYMDFCITVSAVDRNLDLCYFSNFGDEVDVCGPGADILSANMGGGYVAYDGTSMAAPHVAAVAAAYKAQDPSLDPAALKETIKSTATPIGPKGQYGAGLVALRADGTRNCALTAETESDPNTDFCTVTLSCAQTADIYYTLDGTKPDKNAAPYTKPFTAEKTCLLRAVGCTENGETLPLQKTLYVESEENDAYTLLTEGDTLTGYLGCIDNETITLPAGITKIGELALDHAVIHELVGSEQITEIGDGAFLNTEFVELPAFPHVRTVGNTAFMASTMYTVDLPEAESIGADAFTDNYIHDISLPAVRTIGESAFSGDNDISTEEVSFPKLVTVGNFAFEQAMNGVRVLSMPEVRTIGDYAFKRMPSDFWFMADSGNCLTPSDPYENVRSIVKVLCPKAETIGQYAFADLVDLREADFSALRKAGIYALDDAGLQSLSLPQLTELPEGFLNYADALETLEIPKVEVIGDYALVYTAIRDLDLPNVTSIGKYGCASDALETVNAPKLLEAGDMAFGYHCMERLELPVVEHVGSGFACCQKFYAPDSLTRIDHGAFDYIYVVLHSAKAAAAEFCEDYGRPHAVPGTMFTVRFYDHRGKLISEQQVEAGESAKPPKVFRLFYRFIGWFDDDWQEMPPVIGRDSDFHPDYESRFAALSEKIGNAVISVLSFFLSPILFLF